MPVFTTGLFPAGGESGQGGGIIQIVFNEKTDTWSSQPGGAWADITGMTLTITPTQSANKILIWPSLNMTAETSHRHGFRILRGSTVIHYGASASNRRLATSGQGNPPNSVMNYHYCTPFLDTPNTTSATTYKLQAIGEGGSTNVYVNRTENDGNNADKFRFASAIMAMEVSS